MTRAFSVVEFGRALRRFLRMLGSSGRRWLAACFLSSLALSLIDYALAGFLQLFLVSLGYFDRAQISRRLLPLVGLSTTGLCGMLVLIGAARSLALFVSAYSNDVMQETANSRFKQVTVHDMLLRRGRAFLPASEVHYRVGELYPKSQTFVFSAVSVLVALIQSLFLVAAMSYLAWKETLIGLVGFGLTGVALLAANQRLARNAKLAPALSAQFTRGVERVSRNWLFVRISRTQSREAAGLLQKVHDYTDVLLRMAAYNTLILGMPPFFGICLFAAIIYLSRVVFMTKAAVLVSILYLFLRLVQYVGNASQYMGALTKFWPQFSEAVSLFAGLGEEDRAAALALGRDTFRERLRERPAPSADGATSGPPEILLEGVSFSWAPGAPRVLDGLSWRVKPGEIAGVVGPSGAGKSTLLLLVLGMIEPQAGRVALDGADPHDYLERAAADLGYVGAEPFLMEGTLLENLAYGAARAPSESEVWAALEQARLAETVRGLPHGLEHRLDENGTGLSTGQKQRLALARALLKRPRLLVLDEATANLDAPTEAEIAQAILRLAGRTTVLIVSHRAGILKAAGDVLELSPAAQRIGA